MPMHWVAAVEDFLYDDSVVLVLVVMPSQQSLPTFLLCNLQ
jgi:hypothetical protein